MKKLLVIGAAVMSAAVCTAADATYVWPDDLATANEITVEYDTTDPTKVKTLTATVASGNSVTLTGGTIDFAADAVVKLSGPGGFTIENPLTGVNGLTVTNAENACILNYNDGLLPSKTFKTIFPGVDLDDIIILYGDQRKENNVPSMSNNQIHYPHFVRRMTVDGVKMMTMQMQIQYTGGDGAVTKCVCVELKQLADGVGARVVDGYYSMAHREGEDLPYMYNLWQEDPDATVNTRANTQEIKASDRSGNYGIGALTAVWSGAPSVKLRGDISGLGGSLMVAKGAVADTLGVTAFPANQTVNGQFIVGDADVTLSGTMSGANDGTLVMAATKPGSYTVTLNSTFNNTVSAAVGQTGRDYNPARIDTRGHVVIKGDSSIGATMTCKLKSDSGMPSSGIVEIHDGGMLEFANGLNHQNGTLRQNGRAKYLVYTGGVIRVTANQAFYTGTNMVFELHGGVLEKRRDGSSSASNMNLYLNVLLLEDGAQVNADPNNPNLLLWMGNANGIWKVRGSLPSYCNVPIQFVGTRTHTIDVANVTGDDAPDFIYARAFGTQNSGSGTTIVTKIGNGTVLSKGDVDIMGGLTVVGGTWQLGASNLWKNKRALTLNGGTLSVSNNTANAIGSLTVGSRGGTIELGEGATLAFDASNGNTWSGIVTIKGFREGAVKFGDSAAALTDEQVKMLRAEKPDGKTMHLCITSAGYLAPRGMAVVIQ